MITIRVKEQKESADTMLYAGQLVKISWTTYYCWYLVAFSNTKDQTILIEVDPADKDKLFSNLVVINKSISNLKNLLTYLQDEVHVSPIAIEQWSYDLDINIY